MAICKGAHALKTGVFSKLHQFGKIFIRFAGVTDHESRSQMNAGHFFTDTVD